MSGDGYAFRSIVCLCTSASIASVLTPGATIAPAASSTSRATRPAARIPSMSFADFTSICHGSIGPVAFGRPSAA